LCLWCCLCSRISSSLVIHRKLLLHEHESKRARAMPIARRHSCSSTHVAALMQQHSCSSSSSSSSTQAAARLWSKSSHICAVLGYGFGLASRKGAKSCIRH
jgi:hypothetical protein